MLYFLLTLKCKTIQAVNNNDRHIQLQNKFNLNINKIDIKDIDFSKLQTIDLFFCWIESPLDEIHVINSIIKYKYKTKFIMSYCDDQNICNNCKLCIGYFTMKPTKSQTKVNELLIVLESESKKNNLSFSIEKYSYNEGNKCRESGIFQYFIIDFTPSKISIIE